MDKRMTTQEIFKNCTELKGQDWKKMYAVVAATLETKKYRMMRNGDTLFWYRMDGPGRAQMYVFNADSYKNLFKNMKQFALAMHKAGFKTVYGETQDINMINLIKRIGFPVDVEKIGKDDKGRQLYRGTVNV